MQFSLFIFIRYLHCVFSTSVERMSVFAWYSKHASNCFRTCKLVSNIADIP